MALLDPYAGPWTERHAAHMLRRVTFGFQPTRLSEAVSAGIAATVDSLLATLPAPAKPKHPTTGESFLDAPFAPMENALYTQYVKAWWAEQLLTTTPNIREKMVLFWMSHFTVEFQAVQNYVFCYQYLEYMRANALGDFKSMTRWVTLSPAMLRYLNGNTNTAGNPNENYARELQELFANGKGPEIEVGNYTTYTESDVKAAARVLTGWREQRLTGVVSFQPRQHDTADKQFSAAYGNRVIRGRNTPTAGNEELDELLDMIFTQEATERHVVRKLYRWFVDATIDADVERDVIAPLGRLLRQSNWSVMPVMRTLLRSQHFNDQAFHGSQISSPADFMFGTLRSLPSIAAPAAEPQRTQFYIGLQANMNNLQMSLGDPPSVAGYEAYHQQPDYDRLWMNTATLPLRNATTDVLVLGQRSRPGMFDTIAYVRSIPNASDPYALIDAINTNLFAVPFPDDVRTTLLGDVLQGGTAPIYEWTQEWETFVASPNNQQLRTRMKAKLDNLFVYLFRMAEYHIV